MSIHVMHSDGVRLFRGLGFGLLIEADVMLLYFVIQDLLNLARALGVM